MNNNLEYSLQSYVICKSSFNIIMQISDETGKTYIAKTLKSLIANYRRTILVDLDTFEKLSEFSSVLSINPICETQYSDGPYDEIKLETLDYMFEGGEYKWEDNSYIVDVPGWMTIPFNTYLLSSRIFDFCNEKGMKFNLHIPIVKTSNSDKCLRHADYIYNVYRPYNNVSVIQWRNHYRGKVLNGSLSNNIRYSKTIHI